jgi:cytochrome c553
MRKTITTLIAVALLAPMSAFADGDAELGRTKAATCTACHGEDGMGIAPNYPVLAGQHAEYLAYALRQYRGGERKNPIMAPFVANLTDDDIEDLAAWFASLPGLSTLKM